MNKYIFKSRLDKTIKNNAFSLYFVEQLFKEERNSLIANEKIETLISDNFDSFLEGIGRGNVDALIEVLYAKPSMREFLTSDDTIKVILEKSDHGDFECVVFDSPIAIKAQEYIKNNIEDIVDNYSIKKITPLYERMDLSESMKALIEGCFQNKKEEFLKDILTSTLSFKGKVDENQLDKLVKIVLPIVDKTLEKEKCKLVDTKVLRGGGFSNVLAIGDTIIKVGLPRKTPNIPNDKRLLQPYLRRDLSGKYGINATIEVCDRVDTNLNLSEDKMYMIYKDIRSRGIVCGDFKYGNIGVLLKDNHPRNNIKNGMIGEVKETLGVGEYVLLDTDFIYKEDDKNIDLTSDMSRSFESRYQKEKANHMKR